MAIVPRDFNFGTVKSGCSSATRTFSIYNTCSTPAAVQSATMVGGGTEFLPVSTMAIVPNAVLPSGGAPVTFSLKYHPLNPGADLGTFQLKVTQLSQTVDHLVTLSGAGDATGRNTDTYTLPAQPRADVLLVLDDGCSMSDRQLALSTHFSSLLAYAMAAQVSWQLGVTTADFGAAGGKIVGTSTNPKILTAATANVELLFSQKVMLGTGGSGIEQLLAPALAGLTAPLVSTDNFGLVRSDAVLGVIAVSDAEDQSPYPVSTYVDLLRDIKGAQHGERFSFSSIGPYLAAAPTGCAYDGAGGAPRTFAAAAATGGVTREICTTDWATTLAQVGRVAFGHRTRFPLTASPDLTGGKTIVVKLGGVPLAPFSTRGDPVWAYDPIANLVNFEPVYVPEPGTQLTISYEVPCLP